MFRSPLLNCKTTTQHQTLRHSVYEEVSLYPTYLLKASGEELECSRRRGDLGDGEEEVLRELEGEKGGEVGQREGLSVKTVGGKEVGICL